LDGDRGISASLRRPYDASPIGGAAGEHAAVAALDRDGGLVAVGSLLAAVLDALCGHRYVAQRG
jgi:hypothetical protein